MKTLLSVAMILASICSSYSSGETLSVVSNYAYIYESASFTAEKILKIENGETVLLLSDQSENNFYYVSYSDSQNEYSGYIYHECLAKLTEEQNIILTYNAKTLTETFIYSEKNNESKTELSITEGTELYLYEGYSRNTEFTAVKLSYNGEIILGYIKTKDVSPYGINNVLIVSITAIIACVGIIFILLGISKKKGKKSIFKKKEKAQK